MPVGPLSANNHPQPAQQEGSARVPKRAPQAATPVHQSAGTADPVRLSAQEQAQVDQLKARDAAVRQREQAHLAAAGGLGAASYTYQRGPNGVNYAVAGQVQLNTAAGRTPQETIARARTVEAAALAPDDPSGADSVALSQAQQQERAARAELAIERAAASAEQAQDAARAQPPVATGSAPAAGAPAQAATAKRSYGSDKPPDPTISIYA
jgi:hypothetical protein